MNKSLLKISFFTALFAGLVFGSHATTYTVDNNPGTGAQYTSLQTAIDAALAGDTILVAGSPTNYGNITVKKQLVLIGEGYTGLSSKLGTLRFENLTADAGPGGSFVSGFELSCGLSPNYANRPGGTSSGLSNITIERCKINGIGLAPNSEFSYTSIAFRNSIIPGVVSFSSSAGFHPTFSDVKFVNNIISGGSFHSIADVRINNGVEYLNEYTSTSGVFIKNNLFIGAGDCFTHLIGATVENNIFFGRNPISEAHYNSQDSLAYNINFNNNLLYQTAQDLTKNSWYAVGANNMTGDPQFVNFPPDGAAFSYDHNYQLKTGSPALTAGVNGEDLGIYGATYPFPALDAKPKGPVMTEVKPIGSPSVPAGGTLQVQFKSRIEN